MNKIFFSLFTLVLFSSTCVHAQKSKVQAAWRGLSDYEETLRDGKPNVTYLNKANESIDLALQSEDTKKQARTHAYKMRICYALFQYNLSEEMKKLEPSVGDKNQRMMQAYGNISLADFEKAAAELNTIKDLDTKYLQTIQDGIAAGAGTLDDDDLKFAQAALQMKVESGNIATGKYNSKKYEEAADYFFKTAVINTVLNKTKDTTTFMNACISAAKSGNADLIVQYNQKMLDLNISRPLNYSSMSVAYLQKKDSALALQTIKKGRELFKNDEALLFEEINLFRAMGKSKEALDGLKFAMEKQPRNALLYLFTANLYDAMANPKDATGKDLPKPQNFEELFKNAESNYLKALELKPSGKENLYNTYYDLGALYNNYGGMVANRKIEKITDLVKYQKENEALAVVWYNKAIPNLENALNLKPDDTTCMKALRILYLKTGNDAKAKEMSDRLKK